MNIFLFVITIISLFNATFYYLTNDIYKTQQINLFAAVITTTVFIRLQPFSREGLIAQLKQEEFTDLEIEYALLQNPIDWNEQALRYLKSFNTSLTQDNMRDILTEAQFQDSEIEYAITNFIK